MSKLGGHLVEIADAEVDHPLEPPVAKVRRVFLERCEGRCPGAGPPGLGIGFVRDAGDAEIGLVPIRQFLGILGAKEESTYALHALHVAGSLAWRTDSAC